MCTGGRSREIALGWVPNLVRRNRSPGGVCLGESWNQVRLSLYHMCGVADLQLLTGYQISEQ